MKAYRIINLQWIYMKGIICRKWSWNDFRFIIMNIRSKKWISGLDNFRHLGSACFFANSFNVNPLIRNWISDPFKSSDFFWKILKFIFLFHRSAWTVDSKEWTESVVTFWFLDFPFLCNCFSFKGFQKGQSERLFYSQSDVGQLNQATFDLETVPEITFLSIGLSRPKNEFIFKRIWAVEYFSFRHIMSHIS